VSGRAIAGGWRSATRIFIATVIHDRGGGQQRAVHQRGVVVKERAEYITTPNANEAQTIALTRATT
jgi:hypothetical protein